MEWYEAVGQALTFWFTGEPAKTFVLKRLTQQLEISREGMPLTNLFMACTQQANEEIQAGAFQAPADWPFAISNFLTACRILDREGVMRDAATLSVFKGMLDKLIGGLDDARSLYEKYNRDWFESLHRNAGWLPDTFGSIKGWKKPGESSTRFPFAFVPVYEDIPTVETHPYWCDSYSQAVALAYFASDKLNKIDQRIRVAVPNNEVLTDWDPLIRDLLIWCDFQAIFSAQSLESGRKEMWLAEGAGDIQDRAYKICVFVLNNKREWLLPYLLSKLMDISDTWATYGALSFVHRALKGYVLANADVEAKLLDLQSRQTSLPYGSQRLLAKCVKLLRRKRKN